MPYFLPASILPTQKLRKLRGAITVLVLALLALGLVFKNLGKWLVVEDPLRKSAAIAVLSGGMPGRALEAARVYRQGYAGRIWLTHSIEPGATMTTLSIPYVAEEEYNRQILIHEGVPESSIEVLEPPIVNTADEMKTIGQRLKTLSDHTVIIVTSPVHTRRTKALWSKLSRESGTALLHGVSDDSYDARHWWRTTHDALDVVREVLGLLNVWAGLPLRPSQ
ncbi:MAG TPA: YdcF family protein [Dongiaceae bacterium]|nr:YdcF family protein [Dongiaceae bacterium]